MVRYFISIEKELRNHVIPLVDETHSTIRSPKGRAISGLSMGGCHSMFIGFRSLDLFASFGILSTGDTNAETSLAQFLNDPEVNEKVDYLFVGQLVPPAHPELSPENPDKVSGNYDLPHIIISGLQWIQTNIAAFGGCPDSSV